MTRITLNELDETMEEIPAKLMLIINAIDKGKAETNGLLRTLINELKTVIQNNIAYLNNK